MKLPPFAASIDTLSKALSFTDIDLYSILIDDDASVDDILNSTLAIVACQVNFNLPIFKKPNFTIFRSGLWILWLRSEFTQIMW